MRVLGVDPGSRITGYGIVEKSERMLRCVRSGQIKTRKGAPFPEKIHQIFQGIRDLIETYHPRQMAIEDIFYAKNVKSFLKLDAVPGPDAADALAAAICHLNWIRLDPRQARGEAPTGGVSGSNTQ